MSDGAAYFRIQTGDFRNGTTSPRSSSRYVKTMSEQTEQVTLLLALENGDANAAEQLLPLVYNELRSLRGKADGR